MNFYNGTGQGEVIWNYLIKNLKPNALEMGYKQIFSSDNKNENN